MVILYLGIEEMEQNENRLISKHVFTNKKAVGLISYGTAET